MIGFFSVAFFFTALQGRKHWRDGRGITEMNIDWHKKYQDTGEMGDIRTIPEQDNKS
jgi:hypothetical protein